MCVADKLNGEIEADQDNGFCGTSEGADVGGRMRAIKLSTHSLGSSPFISLQIWTSAWLVWFLMLLGGLCFSLGTLQFVMFFILPKLWLVVHPDIGITGKIIRNILLFGIGMGLFFVAFEIARHPVVVFYADDAKVLIRKAYHYKEIELKMIVNIKDRCLLSFLLGPRLCLDGGRSIFVPVFRKKDRELVRSEIMKRLGKGDG